MGVANDKKAPLPLKRGGGLGVPTKFFVSGGVGYADDDTTLDGAAADKLNLCTFLKPLEGDFVTVAAKIAKLHRLP